MVDITVSRAASKDAHVALFLFEGQAPKVPGVAVSKEEFQGKAGQLLLLRPQSGRKIALAGLGKEKDFWTEVLRRAAGKACRALRDSACEEFSIVLPELKGHAAGELARAAAEAAVLSLYKFDKYKSKEPDSPKSEVKSVRVCGGPEKAVEDGALLGKTVAECVNLSRSLADEPANVATPEWMEGQARLLAGKLGLRVEVLGCKELAKEGLGGLCAVSRGSEHEGRLVVLEYAPKGREKEQPFVIVGKGVCFDAGGLDIKPAGQFADMKYDKSGACAVLGVMRACAEAKIPLRVVGLMPLVENLPGGRAYKPGDIIRIAGKSIEVANTDAEGRIILADALAYSQRFKPRAIVDIATLTGACLIALGDQAAGVMGNDQELVDSLMECGRASGERLWQFPLWPEYLEQVKSEIADVKNLGAVGAGGRGLAGAIAGGAFLKHFADPAQWAHLDIAGTANVAKQADYISPGATGAGVRVVTEFLLRRSGRAARRR